MLKQTDLNAVKRFAVSLLYLDIKTTEFSPLVVSHPFTDSGITGLPGEDGHIRVANLLTNEEDMRQWRDMKQDTINSATTVMQIAMMITPPYLIGFFKFTAPLLSKEDHAKILAYSWVYSEHPDKDPNLSPSRLLGNFKTADPKHLMDEDEYAVFLELPDLVEVYRGINSQNRTDLKKTLSWTLSVDTARWFAHRYGEQGEVWKGFVPKERIYAYFGRRGESEVIVDPKWCNSYIQIS